MATDKPLSLAHLSPEQAILKALNTPKSRSEAMSRDEVMRRILRECPGSFAGETAKPGNKDFDAAAGLNFTPTGSGPHRFGAKGPRGGNLYIGIWTDDMKITCGRKE